MPGIKPQFNRDMPTNWKHFFNSESDAQFKTDHPFLYKCFVFMAILSFVLPLIAYLWLASIFAPGCIGNLVIYVGLIGCACITVSLFNICAAFLHQYLGHKVSFVSLTIGVLICSAALLIIDHM